MADPTKGPRPGPPMLKMPDPDEVSFVAGLEKALEIMDREIVLVHTWAYSVGLKGARRAVAREIERRTESWQDAAS